MWGGTTLKYILGVKVRNHRQERGLSLKELAEQESQTQTTTLGDLLAEKLGNKSDE